MGRLRAKQDKSTAIISSSKSIKKRQISSTPLRRSGRLNGKSCDFDSSSSPPEDPLVENFEEEAKVDDQVSGNSNYESIRNARISENKARLASLGLERGIKELEAILFPPKTIRKCTKFKPDLESPIRRSSRLKGNSDASPFKELSVDRDDHFVKVKRRLFSKTERCSSKARGSIYDPVLGICCHFCRQKKLCGEEDCKRCGDRDMDQPCIGKTDCSVCHSSNGVMCRACLKVRYGEDMEDVRAKNDWMCPHCIEEKGFKPYWICNSSLCLKKRKMVPTGIAIYQAREEGYESVAHSIMDKLKKKASQFQ